MVHACWACDKHVVCVASYMYDLPDMYVWRVCSLHVFRSVVSDLCGMRAGEGMSVTWKGYNEYVSA